MNEINLMEIRKTLIRFDSAEHLIFLDMSDLLNLVLKNSKARTDNYFLESIDNLHLKITSLLGEFHHMIYDYFFAESPLEEK